MSRGISDLAVRICFQTLVVRVDVAVANTDLICLLADVAEAATFDLFWGIDYCPAMEPILVP